MELGLQPQGEAMVDLLDLNRREQEQRARVDEVSAEARRAQEELALARAALIEAERRGDDAEIRAKLERRLAAASKRAQEPWAERLAGAERAAQDARHAVQIHAGAHLSELVAEIEQAGAAAAERVDDAARGFLAAVAACQSAERDLIQIVAATGRRMGPHDVSRLRSGEAANAVTAFLQQGGERAATLRVGVPVSA
jgi:hypothetical protein